MVEIPVIDISDSNIDAGSQLLAAATANGFVFVMNNDATGLSERDIQSMFELSASFFAAPTEVKDECSINRDKVAKNRGWLGMHVETLDPAKQKKGDFKEAFNFSPHDPPQILAGPLANRRDTLLEFQTKCHTLCQRLLRLFASALSVPPTWFEERHDMSQGPTGSIMRLLYYPSLETIKAKAMGQVPSDGINHSAHADRERQWQDFEEGEDVRAGAHSDYGSVTLLFQQRGQPGLEILTADGKWAPVPIDPGNAGPTLPILVNIGDLLSYWTNGLLKSTVHRVIFPPPSPGGLQHEQGTRGGAARDRYSLAYFCHPLDAATLEPVPSERVARLSGSEGARRELDKVRSLGGGGDGRAVLTARDHLDARLGATYGVKGQG